MTDLLLEFRSKSQWDEYLSARISELNKAKLDALDSIKNIGIDEPITLRHHDVDGIKIDENNLHETVSVNELNSRKRALLFKLNQELALRNLAASRLIKIFAPEALTKSAMILRGKYPLFLGSEYLPSKESQEFYYPVHHVDLQKTNLPKESFDAFFAGDVFEHIPDLDQALVEIYRILKTKSFMMTTFPFDSRREGSIVKAHMSKDGDISYLSEPEYHGNPVDPESGSLVYSLPGWDILERLKSVGFNDAYFSLVLSSRYGIIGDQDFGVFVLCATKDVASSSGVMTLESKNECALSEPNSFVEIANEKDPPILCTLMGLPRSGTTLVTSMFAVHPHIEAVYEPWNSKLLPMDSLSSIHAFTSSCNLNVVKKRVLFVKETSANIDYIDKLISLHDSVLDTDSKKSILILRHPDQVFYSEIQRRSEWWGDNVVPSLESFEMWCEKSMKALEKMLSFSEEVGGCIITLEKLSRDPEEVMKSLSAYIGIDLSPRQLNYSQYLNKKIVRGDLTVSKAPSNPNSLLANHRQIKRDELDKFINQSKFKKWYQDYINLWCKVDGSVIYSKI